MTRLEVMKTYKLFIGGKFPRSESGRSLEANSITGKTLAHLCQASRKDLRAAVEAAAKTQTGWASRTAYNRGQILYRMAEMLEGKHGEFTAALTATVEGGKKRATKEVDAAIDCLIYYAGWCDKIGQVLGCNNAVAGPYYNFTIPEPMGVVAVVAPDEQPLLGLITLLASPLCVGNAIVALGSAKHPLATSILGEVIATSDVPGGVINLLTGYRTELLTHIANHREIAAIHAANLTKKEASTARLGASENVKRVTIQSFKTKADWYAGTAAGDSQGSSAWLIEPFVEMKTIWHPTGV